MSVYEYSMQDMTATYKLKEQHIYGNARLGMRTDTLEMIAASIDSINYTRTLGQKRYELANHLGNVLSVITDKKIPVDFDTDDIVDYYLADILSATDYSPFGAKMPARDFSNTPHRISFQGQEEDEETDFIVYKYRNYNPKERRFDQPDPLAAKFPYNSTYAFSENRLIDGVELEGLEVVSIHGDVRVVFGVFNISYAAGVIFDSEGIAIYNTLGGGLAVGVGVTVGGGVSIIGADKMEDLKGWGFSYGGFGVAAVGFEVSVDHPADYSSGGATGAISPRAGAGFGFFAEANYTWMTGKVTYYELVKYFFGENENTKNLANMFFESHKNFTLNKIKEDINKANDNIKVIENEVKFWESQKEILKNIQDFNKIDDKINSAKDRLKSEKNNLENLNKDKKEVENMKMKE